MSSFNRSLLLFISVMVILMAGINFLTQVKTKSTSRIVLEPVDPSGTKFSRSTTDDWDFLAQTPTIAMGFFSQTFATQSPSDIGELTTRRPTANTTTSTATTTPATTTRSTTTSTPKPESMKVILQPTVSPKGSGNLIVVNAFNKMFSQQMNFEGCEFSNCRFQYSSQMSEIPKADVVLQGFWVKLDINSVKGINRQRQPWIVYTHEPAGLARARWRDMYNDFNGTMAYTRESTIYFPWGETLPLSNVSKDKAQVAVDYAKGRSKGAYAYVSNCRDVTYPRLQFMKNLAKYISVDIFGGCTKNRPCKKGDAACEANTHKDYRFYLAFENSLCKDYISEKFWKTLHSNGNFLPVAVGGLSVEEYTGVAPPDSFIHAYNFSSIDQLGQYLRHLMDDDTAYNKYHQWRGKFYTTNNELPKASMCELCHIAHKPVDSVKAIQHRNFASEFNNASNCRHFPYSIDV